MLTMKITEATRSEANGLTVKIEPINADVSGSVFLEKLPVTTSGMIIGKQYYLLSSDEYTPSEPEPEEPTEPEA